MLIATLAMLLAAPPTPEATQSKSVQPKAAPSKAFPPDAPRTVMSHDDLGFVTAGELAARCNETSAAGTSYCFAYIAAVHDSVRAYEAWLHLSEFCVPRGTTQSELRHAFIDHMAAHGGDRSGQAASVVVGALKQRYGCLARR